MFSFWEFPIIRSAPKSIWSKTFFSVFGDGENWKLIQRTLSHSNSCKHQMLVKKAMTCTRSIPQFLITTILNLTKAQKWTQFFEIYLPWPQSFRFPRNIRNPLHKTGRWRQVHEATKLIKDAFFWDSVFRRFLFRYTNNRTYRISIPKRTDFVLFWKQNSWRDKN